MTPAMCVKPPEPSMTLLGKTGSRGDYRSTPTTSATDDSRSTR